MFRIDSSHLTKTVILGSIKQPSNFIIFNLWQTVFKEKFIENYILLYQPLGSANKESNYDDSVFDNKSGNNRPYGVVENKEISFFTNSQNELGKFISWLVGLFFECLK